MAAFQFYLQLGKQKSRKGAKSGKKGGWGMTVMLFLAKDSVVKKEA
jgi:hypothetical protein